MKCLMIKPQWVAKILSGEKTIEYRSWRTDHRGDFLIGCSSTPETNAYLCAVVSLDDITFNRRQNLYEWHLSNVRCIKPLPVRGQLRLFECGVDTVEYIDGNDETAVNAVYDEADKWILKQKGR